MVKPSSGGTPGQPAGATPQRTYAGAMRKIITKDGKIIGECRCRKRVQRVVSALL